MNKPILTLRRITDDEPYFMRLVIWATNGTFAGGSEVEWCPDEWAQCGEVISVFPTQIPAEYSFGNDGFMLCVSTTDSLGHCALQITINDIEECCRFSIPCEPSALERLGKLLVEFAKCQHLELHWSPELGGDELFKEHQT